jgi:PAS domain-containing protein
MARSPSAGDPFKLRAFLQHSREPVFILNRQRRLRFANSAWEQLTKQPLDEAYGMNCSRRRTAEPLAQVLSPPPK